MKYLINTSFFLFIALFKIFGQNVVDESSKTGAVLQDYNRNALTVIFLENNSNYNADLKLAANKINVPDKYDNNNLKERSMISGKDEKIIQQKLLSDKVPNSILAKWFSRSDSGIFNMSVIHERGLYNATDDEVIQASASKVGMDRLKDVGESLIDHSYILVLSFSDIYSMSEKYDKIDESRREKAKRTGTEFEPVKRVKNGWEGKVTGYLFKLAFNDSVMNTFYNDLWIYGDDDPNVMTAKKTNFDNTDFPIQFIMKFSCDADGSQYNAGQILAPATQMNREQLFQKMYNTAIAGVSEEMERKIEAFKVKTVVYKKHPISSKIGKKEGLKTDQRYFVSEIYQNRKGELAAHRKGVVRVKSVTDNRQVATGNSDKYSTFYQTSGVGIQEGMIMQQRNDLGIGLSGGYSIGGFGGGYAKLEINLARFGASIVDIGVTQLKLFGSVAVDGGTYAINADGVTPQSYEPVFTRWNVGLSKGFYFARNFSVAILVGYGQESAADDDLLEDLGFESDDNINVDLLDIGAYATINVTHFIQLMGAVNYYLPVGDAYSKDNESFDGFKVYTDFFEDRKGVSFDLGLRVEF